MKSQNVFIATLPRSGSTLLGMILGAHSQVCHIGESAYWSKLDVHTTKCCCGTIGCQTLIRISKIISIFPNEIESIRTACGMIDSMEEPDKIRHSLSLSSATTNQDIFNSMLQICCIGLDKVANAARVVSGKEIIIENSKYLTLAEGLLAKDNWQILIVTRDPRGIALCNKEVGIRKGIPRPVKDKINLFVSFAQRVATLVHQNNVLLVRYEDLCRNTLGTLEIVCRFMGISFEERMLEFKRYKGHLLMGNHMMHDSNQEIWEDVRWHNLLSSEEKCLFMNNDLIEAYSHLGYDLTRDS